MKIRVIEFDGLHPAPAYTDFSAVYVSTTLSGEQRRTALRHERAHIWLQHQVRRKTLEQEIGPLDRKIWNIAIDLEIARHIYTQRDDDAITEIRSALSGGIRRCHCDQYPNSLYAEEYYSEIMNSAPPDGADSMDGDASEESVLENSDEEKTSNPKELVNKARDFADESSDDDEKTESAKQTQRSIDGFRPPKPSLASLIDMHIGRTVRSRSDSYRRPSRRQK